MARPRQGELIATTTALEVAKPKPKPRRRQLAMWAVQVDEDGAKTLARAAREGTLDALHWGNHDERRRIMEGLAAARAILFGHERVTYDKADCQHVGAMIASGTPPSRIIVALVGAYRDPWWRQRHGVSFREIASRLESLVTSARKDEGRAPRVVDKREAIDRYRAAYEELPLGLRLDFVEQPDFTYMTAEQIAGEADDMLRASTTRRKK